MAKSISKVKKQKILNKVTSKKVPKSKANHIGVEVECFIPVTVTKEEVMLKFDRVGLSDKITMKHDGSITPEKYHYGIEICVLVRQSNLKKDIKALCEVLSEVRARVNKSCGLHVHLDMRNRNLLTGAKNLFMSQNFLFSIVSPTRRNSTYCAPATYRGRDRDFDNDRTHVPPKARYQEITDIDFIGVLNSYGRAAINYSALQTHKTIEVRMHQGSTSFIKIYNWVYILLHILESDVSKTHKIYKVESKNPGPKKFFNLMNFPEPIVNYVKERQKAFTKKEMIKLKNKKKEASLVRKAALDKEVKKLAEYLKQNDFSHKGDDLEDIIDYIKQGDYATSFGVWNFLSDY